MDLDAWEASLLQGHRVEIGNAVSGGADEYNLVGEGARREAAASDVGERVAGKGISWAAEVDQHAAQQVSGQAQLTQSDVLDPSRVVEQPKLLVGDIEKMFQHLDVE